MSKDTPPPFPPLGDDESIDLFDPTEPPPFPSDPSPGRGQTNTQFAMEAVAESPSESTDSRQRRAQAQAKARAPAERPPTLLPNSQAAQPIRGPSTVRPGVMNPVQRRPEVSRPLRRPHARESSDVIAGLPDPAPSLQRAARRRPEPARPARRPAAGGPARPAAPDRRSFGTAAPNAQPAQAPLSPVVVAAHAASHRRRLKTVFNTAKFLEICAGLLGTASLAMLTATAIRLFVDDSNDPLMIITALMASFLGFGTTVAMVAVAVTMRQMAQTSAETSALIDGLCQVSPPPPH